MNWSDASASCRLEWRRSRWMIAWVIALGVAACVSLWLSDLPRAACWAAQAIAATYASWTLVREARSKPVALAWAGGDAPWQVECDGRTDSMGHVAAGFRGGLVVLTLREGSSGRLRRFVWWPDTLGASERRALRLATAAARGNETPGADA